MKFVLLFKIVITAFVLIGCSHFETKSNQIYGFFDKNNLNVIDTELSLGTISELDAEHVIYKSDTKSLVKIFKTNFATDKEAIKHLMNRQVAISAMFRDLFEPYYGLVQKKKCVDLSQFNTDLISDGKGSSYFSARIPVDKYLNPFDCDHGQPYEHAQYTFLYCAKDLAIFEIRQYHKVTDPFKVGPILSCRTIN